MIRSQEILNKIESLKNEVKTLQGEGKVDEALAKLTDIENTKKEYDLQKKIEDMEKQDAENEMEQEDIKDKSGVENMTTVKRSANFVRAMLKQGTGRAISNEEKEILNSLSVESGNGVEYILPQDISTKIHELLRSQKCIKNYVGHLHTDALTGSFPIEDFETVSELVDFTDGNDLSTLDFSKEIKFKQVKFALKEKGGFIGLTNTLLKMTDNNLINYVARIFARKALLTYNKMGIEALKKDKKVKSLKDVKALVKSINVDLDPAMLSNSVALTNQDGYNKLMELADSREIPFLQRDLSKGGALTVNNMPIVRFPNNMIPSIKGKAPIFYGNLTMGVSFVDCGKYNFALSTEAGFTKNMTLARVIDYVDCIQVDSSDKVYIVGELDIEDTTVTK
ncbi:phage major capsid protein [Clostridium botulinum]|uniref:phage major capsid protein n=1 Tax=Clostridium botulinum TaxID=1491 RepID=UPI001E2DC2F1|nr:phage major capsid protein [Clostridium botulinum]MCD3223944.1 phage major capsid protein [Clostridium botulinum C/D]MCD3296293.1 phage major capsid protein [Clostridium botulinum C/D]